MLTMIGVFIEDTLSALLRILLNTNSDLLTTEQVTEQDNEQVAREEAILAFSANIRTCRVKRNVDKCFTKEYNAFEKR